MPSSTIELPQALVFELYRRIHAATFFIDRIHCAARSLRTICSSCAGAGGKTTHMAALMENEGEIVAADIQTGKLEALEATARKWGITTVKTAAVDAASAAATASLGLFDRVLVDAPCSGLGTLRRNPEIRWHLTEKKLGEFPPLQKRILENAADCVNRGGTLLYSTCSVMPEENDGVVEARQHCAASLAG